MRHRLTGCLLLAALCAVAAPAQQEPPAAAPAPQDSNVVERIRVELAEVQILVTDKRGNPIGDLQADEVRVFEDGKEQRLAFIESVSGSRYAESVGGDSPTPAMVFTAEGDEVDPGEASDVLPAKAVRRMVFVFDVRNSKMNIRENWEEAAQNWLEEKMQPDDQVAIVVLRSFPQWLVDFTSNRDLLANALKQVSLLGGTPDRDRGREMSRLVDDIFSLCKDPNSGSPDRRDNADRRGGKRVDEQSCSYNITEGYVQEWDRAAKETIEVLRALTGQLAAIPGRKSVIMFSEGFVPDATAAGVQAMVAVFGINTIDMPLITWRMDRSSVRELNELHKTAKAGKVSFFTLDTTRSHDHGFEGNLERATYLSYQNMGVNPWSEMSYATRGSLTALAKETGGRSYHGVKDLAENVAAAADSFFGHYVVGYYRSDPETEGGKVKVRIDRRKLDVTYPDKPTLWPHRPNPVKLDLIVGRPEVAAADGSQALPIVLHMQLEDIPLRRGDGGQGCQIGAYIQALRPDGSLAGERLEVVTVVLDREQRRTRQGKAYQHRTSLTLPPGPYRIRARVSDDRQEILADRAIDLTLRIGSVEGGLQETETVAQEPAGSR